MTLNEDATAYTVKSATNEASIVNLTITRTAPGFQVGRNGTSYFGTDPKNPWGSMRHVFWPRCQVEGTIVTKEGNLDFKGRGFLSHALQGMKPHHAGKHLIRCSSTNSDDMDRRKMELHEFPITHLLSSDDGVHHSPILWFHFRHRRRHREKG